MYKILFARDAEKDVKHIFKTDRVLFDRIKMCLNEISLNPAVGKPLKMNLKGKWSYRIGQYRIIYSVEHKDITVYVLDIGHRREIYG